MTIALLVLTAVSLLMSILAVAVNFGGERGAARKQVTQLEELHKDHELRIRLLEADRAQIARMSERLDNVLKELTQIRKALEKS
jgi:Flp pilus assembly protein TadB